MDIATLAAAKRYTNETVIGMGALKGAPCTVKSVTPVTGGNEVILSWTATDGSVTENSFVVKDGVSVVGVSIDTTTNSLIVELSDGSTKNAGVLPKGEKGDTGFSPTITENPDNTNEIYKLDVTNEDGTFTTPNLKGTGGGLDPDKYYDKAQINALIEPLDEAKHTHDNKDTVLDKLTTNDTGDTLLFNGNAIKGSVEIDDTTTTAIDKVWSAKKTNDTFEEVKQSVTDTNAKFADYDTSAEVDGKITTALTGYEKTEDVDNKLAEYDKSTVVDKKITDALTNYDTSEDVDNKLKDYAKTTEVDTKLSSYYKKTETYSNTEVDTKITDLTTELKAWVNGDESLGIKTALYTNNTLMFYKKPNATITDVADFTIVVPETVATIGDSTADTALASVKAIKDFVAAELAKIPAAVDYTVTITDETAGTGEKSKQTIKQGKAGEETTIGTITVPNLVMTVKETPTEGYLKTYQFTYGTGTPFEVDIPKDLVVTAGEVIVVSDDAPVTGLTNGTYLKLTIANQTAPVYIDVKDLADVYTGKAETTGVSVAISASNEISATLVGKAVAEENLADALATKVNGADEALTWGAIS